MVADNYWTPGWKVLADRRSPCVAGPAARHYPVGEIILPARRCGPLAVFTSDEEARQWVDVICGDKEWAHIDVAIVHCGYVGSAESGLWHPLHPDVAAAAARLSRHVIGEVMSHSLASCPPGTRLADAVCCWE